MTALILARGCEGKALACEASQRGVRGLAATPRSDPSHLGARPRTSEASQEGLKTIFIMSVFMACVAAMLLVSDAHQRFC